VTCDADIWIENDSLSKIVCLLGGEIGAVSGVPVLDGEHKWYTLSKLNYHKRDFSLRAEESKISSCCSLDGRLMAFDRRLVPRFPDDTLVDDYELTFLVIDKGFRAVICEDAIVHEDLPGSLMQELRQIRRRSVHGLLTNKRYLNYLFNKRFGFFGLFTYPFHRFFINYIPILLAYILVFAGYAFHPLALLILVTVILLLLFSKQNFFPIILVMGILCSYLDLIFHFVFNFHIVDNGGVWER
jgi:cellulose synthase/poly-beta-1,6-N-acetylglucosamine synthase-like glycosyltransferase